MNETAKEFLDNLTEELNKSIEFIKSEYQVLRAGRANPHILDKIVVDYYGSPTPIIQMANISVPEARVLMISVWDVSQLQNVSKAISASDIGITPIDDGKVIRLIFPPLTEERRRELVKSVKQVCENGKISIRNSRRDCLDVFKQMKKDSEISEDEYNSLEKEVQKQVDACCDRADELSAAKEKEVMEV